MLLEDVMSVREGTPISISRLSLTYWVSRLRRHLKEAEDLAPRTISERLCGTRVFLRYLSERNLSPASVTPADMATYLRSRRNAYWKRHGRERRDEKRWRSQHTEASLAMKEQVLSKTTPPKRAPGRYRPDDRLLEFLNNL